MVQREIHTFSSPLEELSEAECLELLSSKRVGRIAWCSEQGPRVLPVNYTLADRDILIRTSPDSPIEKSLYETHAAFQVDDIDEFLEAGWSVLVTGEATYVNTRHRDERVPARLQDTWAPGVRDLLIRIRSEEITGRRLHAGR
jgi:nitroimidazol reductase NimA-like FMN-containing flavoprotein (pyridoxamine 5'-phosphate oxidase superfamily)